MKQLFIILIFGFSFFLSKAQFPPFDWSKSFGNTGKTTIGTGPRIDQFGNIYLIVVSDSLADLDPGPLFYSTNNVVNIVKLDKYGNFLWATGIKEWGAMSAYGTFTIDSLGNIYLLSNFQGVVDFDPGPGVLNYNAINGSNVLIKLNSLGQLVFAKQFGSSQLNNARISIGIKNTEIFLFGSIYLSGDYDPGIATYNINTTFGGSFISKLDANGNLIWMNFFETQNINNTSNISNALSAICFGANSIYVTGSFNNSVDFAPGPPTNIITNFPFQGFYATWHESSFLIKMDFSGNIQWVKILENGLSDEVKSPLILTDINENIYMAGLCSDTVDFDLGPGIINHIASGLNEKFILKMDSAANFIWLRNFVYTPSSLYPASEIWDFSMDKVGNLYVFSSNEEVFDMDPGLAINQSSILGSSYIKLDNNGNYIWSMSMDSCFAGGILAIDDDSLFYICNPVFDKVLQTDLDPNPTVYLTDTTKNNAYLVKLAPKSISVNENAIKLKNGVIYPNPTKSKIYIEQKKEELDKVELINIQGEILQTWENENEMDLSSYPSGIYYVRISASKNVFTQKILKQ